MKAKFKSILTFACAAACALSFTACSPNGEYGNTLLGEPKKVESVEYSELNTDDYKAFKNGVDKFAADFAAHTYADYKKQDNFAVSPISVYMALALSAQCAAGDTRQEIVDAMGVSYEQLIANFSTLYRSLEVEHKIQDKVTGRLDLTNSIWVNEGTKVKQACINSLSDDFYAYSYSADFAHHNSVANKAVRDFVNKQTKGLIDKDFKLSDKTLFTLINTVYLKSIWNTDGDELPLTRDKYDFTTKNGSVKNVKLLQGYYNSGRVVEFDAFSTFYTTTEHGYTIKFILPDDGFTVDQVFTSDNIAAVNAITSYNEYNDENTECYITRVLFPEYKCKYDEDIADILREKFDINMLFNANSCDFSTLSDEHGYCEKVRHVTDLTVNKKGIEGAAVTLEPMAGNAAPPEIVIVKKDFVVNKAFGFIITDWDNTTLFSGVVNNI